MFQFTSSDIICYYCWLQVINALEYGNTSLHFSEFLKFPCILEIQRTTNVIKNTLLTLLKKAWP